MAASFKRYTLTNARVKTPITSVGEPKVQTLPGPPFISLLFGSILAPIVNMFFLVLPTICQTNVVTCQSKIIFCNIITDITNKFKVT